MEPIREYFRETFGELRKVHWPTRIEARNLTAVVLGVTVAMALFLGAFDYAFGQLIESDLTKNIIAIAITAVIVLSILVLLFFASRDRH